MVVGALLDLIFFMPATIIFHGAPLPYWNLPLRSIIFLSLFSLPGVAAAFVGRLIASECSRHS